MKVPGFPSVGRQEMAKRVSGEQTGLRILAPCLSVPARPMCPSRVLHVIWSPGRLTMSWVSDQQDTQRVSCRTYQNLLGTFRCYTVSL